jgi:hypothetical protein
MKKRAVLVALALMVGLGATAALAQEQKKIPGDKRRGEEREIRMREEWFDLQRALDKELTAGKQRARAVEEQILAMAQPGLAAVPGSWAPVGPSPMTMPGWAMGRVAGRVSALMVSPTSESVMFLGTASGGLWKTTDGGANWNAVFDSVGTQTIGALAIDPNDANRLWVGTGEQRQKCSDYFGMGLFQSLDGGATFTDRNGSGSSALGLSNVTAVAVKPGDSNLILAGGPGECVGGAFAAGGLRRSTDGGATWALVLAGPTNDVIFDPLSPNVVYAAVGSGSTDPNGGLYRSTDSGATWSALSNGVPTGAAAGRTRLAMAPTNRQVLYALVNRSAGGTGLYRTVDGGTTWTLRNNSACDGQCTYNLTLDVSPTTSDTVIVGAVRIYRSTDGGTTLSVLTTTWGSSQKVHQDTHVVRYSRTNGSRFWVGSDGGLWRTDDAGTNYSNLNANLNITQFYDVAVHPTNSGLILGGSQDNSSERRSTSSVWDVVTITGDGFTNAWDPGNTNYAFIESYPTSTGPNIYRSTTGGGVNSFSGIGRSGISSGASVFPWKTEFVVMNSGATSYIITGSSHLYRANARSNSVRWTAISGNLAASVLSSLGPLPSGVLYAGFQNGKVFRTSNAYATTVTWTDVTGGLPSGWVSDLAVDPADSQRVFATRSVFGGNKLYGSTTGGTTWTALGSGLPDVPANTVAIDPLAPQRLFVGTDLGVYVSEDGGATFVPQMTGMPLGAVVTDLEIDDFPHLLTAGTYGRGAWQLTLP